MLQAVLTRFPVPVWFLTKESSWLSQISHVLRQEVKLCRGRVQTGGVSRPSSICFFPRSFLKKKRRRRRQRRRWRSSPWIFLPMHAALKQERISQTWRDYLLPEKPSACIRFQLWAYCTGFAKCSPSLHPDIMWYHVISCDIEIRCHEALALHCFGIFLVQRLAPFCRILWRQLRNQRWTPKLPYVARHPVLRASFNNFQYHTL